MFNFFSLFLKNVSSPHPKNFPLVELLEEAHIGYFLIKVSFNKPVCEGDVLHWLIVDVGCDSLLGKREELFGVFLLLFFLFYQRFQVVGIFAPALLGPEVNVESIIIRLTLKKCDKFV